MAFLLFLLSLVAFAQDDEVEPTYLLGEVGVRVDLDPEDWEPVAGSWSDRGVQARMQKGNKPLVQLYAFRSHYQVTPRADDLAAWGEMYAKWGPAVAGGGDNFRVVDKRIGTRHGVPSLEFELAFDLTKDEGGTMFAVGFPTRGQVFHLALASNDRMKRQMHREIDALIDRVEVRTTPEELVVGGTAQGEGVSFELPKDYWRVPLDVERAMIQEQVGELVELKDGCAVALHAHPGDGPADVLITCTEDRHLGIVDDYTFDDHEVALRTAWFGSIADKIGPAERVRTPAQLGFLFEPTLEGLTMFVGGVPYEQGIAKTTVMGRPTSELRLSTDVKKAMIEAGYSGPVPVSFGDNVSYYLTYRTFSPMVLCPAVTLVAVVLAVLLVVGGGLVLLSRRKPKYALDDDI